MTGVHVVADGIPNEPIARSAVLRLVEPILDLLGGISADDVQYLRIDQSGIRAKVVVRNKRGRRLHESWAHVGVRIVPDDVEVGS